MSLYRSPASRRAFAVLAATAAMVLAAPPSANAATQAAGRDRGDAAPLAGGGAAGAAESPAASIGFPLYLPVPWGQRIDAGGPHFFCGSQCASGAAVLNSVDLGYAGDQTGTMDVYAAADGVLAFHADYGYDSQGHPTTLFQDCWASIDHVGGWRTTYYHLTKPDLSLAGTTVHAGQRIATDGYPNVNTCGSGNIAHLHFSLWHNPPTIGGTSNGTAIAIDSTSIGGYTVHAGSGTNCGYGADSSGHYSYFGSWTRDSDGALVIGPGCFERPSLVNNILRPPSSLPPNLLRSASFEGGGTGWTTLPVNGGVMGYATYQDSALAHEGSWFGEANTSTASGSLYQDVSVGPGVGRSYSFSIWLRSPTGVPLSGTVALWALGGTVESGTTNFTVGSQWTLVTSPLNVANAGHTSMRAQVYLSATGVNYDFDGAQLLDDGLAHASFEGGFSGWLSLAVGGGVVNVAAYSDVSRSHDGSWFGEANTSTPGGSIYQDAPIAAAPGQSYTFSMWLRSPTGAPLSGTLALWALGGTTESGATNFTLGSQWTLVSAPVNVSNAGHTSLRAQMYMSTTGANFDFDSAQLTNALLKQASFEGGFSGWLSLAVGGGVVNVAAYQDASRSREGSWFGEANTSTSGGSIYQDVSTAAQPAQSYTFAVWLRSPTGVPLSGTVVLWALGGTTESGTTGFTVGSQWTLVSVPVNVSASGHTSLRAQVYMGTTGINYDFDGATFASGNQTASPPLALSVSDVSKAEGNGRSTKFVFTVSMAFTSPSAVSVDYTTADGTAIKKVDYRSVSGTLTIPAGATSGTITVTVLGDTVAEPNETFTVNLSNVLGAIIADGQGVGTILNDD